MQYFRPSLSYHLSLRPLLCLFLSGPLRQVLLLGLSLNRFKFIQELKYSMNILNKKRSPKCIVIMYLLKVCFKVCIQSSPKRIHSNELSPQGGLTLSLTGKTFVVDSYS